MCNNERVDTRQVVHVSGKNREVCLAEVDEFLFIWIHQVFVYLESIS